MNRRKTYYEENREEILKKEREARNGPKGDKIRARRRELRPRYRGRRREYYAENREKIIANEKRRRVNFTPEQRQKRLDSQKKWRDKNRDKIRMYHHNRQLAKHQDANKKRREVYTEKKKKEGGSGKVRAYKKRGPTKLEAIATNRTIFDGVLSDIESFCYSYFDLSYTDDEAYENFNEYVRWMCVYEKKSDFEDIFGDGVVSRKAVNGKKRGMAIQYLKDNNLWSF